MSEERYCKSCFEEIRLSVLRQFIEPVPFLCDDCLSKLKTNLSLRKVQGHWTLFLSDYDGILKKWLMDFKEYGDIELAPCFLFAYLPVIRLFQRNSVFVPVPSRKSRVENRGFSHLEEMLKSSRLPFVPCLEMDEKEDQKTKKAIQRGKKKEILLNSKAKEVQGRNVILFDDVMTSGTTFLSSAEALKKIPTGKIRGLILMDNSAYRQSGL